VSASALNEIEQEVTISPDEFSSVIEALEEGIAQLLMASQYAQSVGDFKHGAEMAKSASKAEKVRDRLANTSPNMYFI
jgi:heme oxygenase